MKLSILSCLLFSLTCEGQLTNLPIRRHSRVLNALQGHHHAPQAARSHDKIQVKFSTHLARSLSQVLAWIPHGWPAPQALFAQKSVPRARPFAKRARCHWVGMCKSQQITSVQFLGTTNHKYGEFRNRYRN